MTWLIKLINRRGKCYSVSTNYIEVALMYCRDMHRTYNHQWQIVRVSDDIVIAQSKTYTPQGAI